MQASDEEIKRFILIVLDDYEKHDWDDAMIAVMDGFAKVGLSIAPRQDELCLVSLIESGEVVESRNGTFLCLQRVRREPHVQSSQLDLFEFNR